MNRQLFIITQNVILIDKLGRVLVLRHNKSGKWLLPGGKINEGEQWLIALSRELNEETGINRWKLENILDIDSYTMNGDYYYSVTFMCKTEEAEIKLSNEHDQFAWLKNSEEIKNYKFWHKDIARRIKIYFSKYKK